MGRLIDADKLKDEVGYTGYCYDFQQEIEDTPTVEAIPKADYEARLKADMVAMLEDLDIKIDEMYEPQFSKEGMDGFYWAQGLFKDLVQQKIDALKADKEPNNEKD